VKNRRLFRGVSVRRTARLVLSAGVLCFSTFAAPAASSVAASPGRQDLTKPLQYEVSVVLKLIHVYVTDKKGKPVEDLSLDDFVVTDNGKPAALTDFERHVLQASPEAADQAGPAAEKNAAAAVAAPSTNRKFFLFFDFAFNNGRGITKARKAALHFLDTQVRPEDEVGILAYSMVKGVVVHEYLTKDHGKIREVVEAIGQKDIAGRAHEIEEQYWIQAQEPLAGETPAAAAAAARNIEAQREESKRIAQTFILKLTALAKALRYVPGQKQFILFSTGVPSSIIYGNQAGNPSGQRDRTRFDPGDRLLIGQNEQMYKEFSASGCTFYAFDTRESAKEANLFAYDDYTFQTGSRGLFGNQGVFQDSTSIFRDDKTTGRNSLERLTDITGGKYYSNISMYEKNLDQVQALTGTYYVLGYSVGETWDGRFHEVKVEVKMKGCEVRAQAGYFSPKPFREYTDLEKRLHLYDLALNERSFSRLPVNFPMTALTFAPGAESRVEIVARIPSEVTDKFSGERVEYVALVFDGKNDIRDMRRLEDAPRPRRGQAVVFTSGATLEPGDYTCRLVIRDMESGLSAASSVRTSVRAAPRKGLRLGTPLLLTDETGCAYLDAGTARARAVRSWAEDYPFDRTALSPVSGQVTKLAPRVVAVVPYSVAGATEYGAAGPDVVLSARLINAATGETLPIAFTLMERNWRRDGEAVGLEFSLVDLAPGKYFLYVNAEDRVSKTLANVQTALTITRD